VFSPFACVIETVAEVLLARHHFVVETVAGL
jgi:hypothetical protein